MIKKGFMLVGLFVATVTLSSCVDEDYDLDDIDMTLALGSEETTFWLPTSSTGAVELKEFLDVKDGEYIQIRKQLKADGSVDKDANGNELEFYCLTSAGKYDMSMNVTVPALVPTATEFDIPMADISTLINNKIDLTNKPKTLDNMRIDLSNAMLMMSAENQAPATIKCDMELSCERGTSTPVNIVLPQFNINSNTTAAYYFSEKAATEKWETQATKGYTWKQTSDMLWKAGLMEDNSKTGQEYLGLPDYIELQLKKMTMSKTGASSGTFPVNTTVEMYAPLCAGPGFSFTNETNEAGLYSEIEMDDDLNAEISSIIMEADIENNMPVDITIQAYGMDDKGNIIPTILPLNANNTKALAKSTTHITMQLKSTAGNFSEYLKKDATTKLDGVQLSIIASGNANSNKNPLRPTDSIKVNNMRLGFKGRIIIDAN